ncbi:MAG: APC family permease [Armatimonadota bacterium]
MKISLRHLLIGKPIPTWRAAEERLPKILALPIFASDAMSSVAYASEAIMRNLLLGGLALHNMVPITGAIVLLLAMVAMSYRQTIFAYPSGGGSYIVAHDNLGKIPGLTAASSLLIDYVLTVSVSTAAGVAAITSTPAGHVLAPYRAELCVAFIFIIALANLRGVRESGVLFALPTYVFIFSFVSMIALGGIKYLNGELHALPSPPLAPAPALQLPAAIFWFWILRSFAGGCTAMTGVEAISNGVQAFRKPESKNAATTLVWMAVILAVLFTGASLLANYLKIHPSVNETETVVSQIASIISGHGWFYYIIQAATAAILILAANTSFAGFPRLCSILAHDRFMPRQLANIGDRLVYSNGIVILAVLASVLVMVFHGEEQSLLPLYAVGVFLSFTLSQYGMVVHIRRLKENNWRTSAVISGVGGTVTAAVTLVMAVTKFMEGAWIVVILIPVLVLILLKINRHYMQLADQLRLPPERPAEIPEMKNTVLVLVPGIHKGVLPAIQYAKSLSPDCRAVYIEADPEATALIEERWEKWGQSVPLVVLESPYRSIVQPILKYLDEVVEEQKRHIVTVVIPEFVPARRWQGILHNQSGLLLKLALLFRKNIVVANIRYYLEK